MPKAKRDFLLFLEDIVESIERIENYTKGMTLKSFLKTPMAVDAVIRNFEIIGEAVKKLPGTFKTKYSDVEWSEAAGFRDVLIHNYFGIDKEAVWDTIKKNVPPFREKIIRVLEEEVSREIRKNSRAKNNGNKQSKERRGN